MIDYSESLNSVTLAFTLEVKLKVIFFQVENRIILQELPVN